MMPWVQVSSLIELGYRSMADLVDSNRLPPELDLVHNLTGIFRILLRQELAEAVALVAHRDSVFGEVDVH